MRHQLPAKIGKGRSIPLSPELLVNMYAEKAPDGAKSSFVVHGTPGFTLFSTIVSGKAKIRGLYRTLSGGLLYCVVDQTLYSISSSGTASSLGTIASSGRVFWAESPSEIVIVAGSNGYTYNTTEGLELITDDDFPGATSVTYQDGYFIFTNRQNAQKDQFFISNLLDGEMYDALDFATAENYPDNLVRVFADHSELLLFGTDSIEIWFNSGAADFPFAPSQGSIIDDGLGATHSLQKLDESVVWLNHEGIVRRLEGNVPVRISDHAIEYLISLGDWENAYSWSYTMEGHQFYVLTVPAANLNQTAGTYVYDAATKVWHQRKSYELDYSRIGFYAYAFGKHIVGDVLTGKLYELSLDTYQENGDHLIAEMHFPQIENDGDRFIVHKFQLDMETGHKKEDSSFGVANVLNSNIFQLHATVSSSIYVETENWTDNAIPTGEFWDLTNIADFDFSPDGKHLCATGGFNYTNPFAYIIRISDWSIVFQDFEISGGSTANAIGCKYSPDGTRLALHYDSTNGGPFDDRVSIYEVPGYDLLGSVGGVDGANHGFTAFSRDSKFFAVADRTSPYFQVRRTSDGSNVSISPADNLGETSRGFAWGDNWLAVGADSDSANYRMLIFNTIDYSVLASFPSGYDHDRMAVSSDGNMLAAASGTEAGDLFIYDMSDTSNITAIAGPVTLPFTDASNIQSMEFSFDGNQLAVFSDNFRPVILSTATWTELEESSSIPNVPTNSKQTGRYSVF